MKNILIKYLSLFITIILVLTFTACGGAQKEKPEETDSTKSTDTTAADSDTAEKPVLTILTTMSAAYDASSELLTFKTWGDKVGAVIQPSVIPTDSYRTKLVTTIASNDMPDIIMARDPADPVADIIDKYGKAGLFVKVDDNWDKFSNLKQWYDKYPEAYKVSTSDDGHIYGMPVFYDFVNTQYGFEVRADLLKKGGIDYKSMRLWKMLRMPSRY